MSDLLRVYLDPDEIGPDGYPHAWHKPGWARLLDAGEPLVDSEVAAAARDLLGDPAPSIKDLVREIAGHRCERCGHPYEKGMGEWSPCDEQCAHGGPLRAPEDETWSHFEIERLHTGWRAAFPDVIVEAQWRILTVHHLNGVKHDCRWWNLCALCQRCHLTIQGRVVMDRVYALEHSEWFKPHAAGWYAASYLGEDLTREETMARLDELLDLERIV